jgi:hypothetical protein
MEIKMRELTAVEMESVSGAAISTAEACGITLGLMALGAGSPFVIGTGAFALMYYAWM